MNMLIAFVFVGITFNCKEKNKKILIVINVDYKINNKIFQYKIINNC